LNPDAALALALLATDPSGLGGAVLRAQAGGWRDAWLRTLRELLPASAPVRRVPVAISDTALLGGLDLGATLQLGRPVVQTGVLAQAHGGLVVLAMAERLPAGTVARLAAVLDQRELVLEREGLQARLPLELGVVALDEGHADDEHLADALADRLAFHLTLDDTGAGHALRGGPMPEDFRSTWTTADIAQARRLLPQVQVPSEVLEALCATAMALGVASLRAPLLALRVARCAAALSGQTVVDSSHASTAARLVLAPRATQMPAPPPAPEEEQAPEELAHQPHPPDAEKPEEPPPPPEAEASPPDTPEQKPETPPDAEDDIPRADAEQALADAVLQAAQAAIPPGLLAALRVRQLAKTRASVAGRSGASLKSQTRGRPMGSRRGEPRAGARLNIIDTLRAAAPWQRLRLQALATTQSASLATPTPSATRVLVRREDFHITRYKQTRQTTTVFVVDASGSAALHRLAEAKGAVELLLADCYVRRDQVAVLAFRGQGAELLLPPTRSLTRAKRSLAGLPGGGGTPLARALDATAALAEQITRRGETPVLVLLTDGRANIARDGKPGRVQAQEDAMASARALQLAGYSALLLDTSPQPQPTARALAEAMGATYVPLPYAGAQGMSQAVLNTAARGRG
jgi:magnesium chelatase subunit D